MTVREILAAYAYGKNFEVEIAATVGGERRWLRSNTYAVMHLNEPEFTDVEVLSWWVTHQATLMFECR